MKGSVARILFVSVCLIIAILLLARAISTIVGSAVFAVALVVLGVMSHGFRRT